MAKFRNEKFNVVHESKKHEVIISVEESQDSTIQDLAGAIAKKCNVPIDKQKLICKGRSLFPKVPSTLKELGVTTKDKILLIGKRVVEEELKLVKEIEKISDDVEELRNKYIERRTEIDSILQEFLDESKRKECLQKLSKQVAGISEGLMKHLESLDSLSLQQDFSEARDKRKTLIVKIQNYLKEHDEKEEKLKEAISKL